MENAVIQHTFLKFGGVKKRQIFNKNPRTPDQTENPRSSVKKQQWQHGL